MGSVGDGPPLLAQGRGDRLVWKQLVGQWVTALTSLPKGGGAGAKCYGWLTDDDDDDDEDDDDDDVGVDDDDGDDELNGCLFWTWPGDPGFGSHLY